MQRFFDWMVKGLEEAADRQCAKRELENKDLEHEAEKRGLKDAYDRQASSLHCQIKTLKGTIAELEQKLIHKPAVLSPAEIAQKMKSEALGYSESQGYSCSIVVTEPMRALIYAASETHAISFRQILSGMVAITWPDKPQ